jgi:hypothetical protein
MGVPQIREYTIKQDWAGVPWRYRGCLQHCIVYF